MNDLNQLVNHIQYVFPKEIFRIIDRFNGKDSFEEKRHFLYIIFGLSKDYNRALLTECSFGNIESLSHLYKLVRKNTTNKEWERFNNISVFMLARDNTIKEDNLNALKFLLNIKNSSMLDIYKKDLFIKALNFNSAKIARFIYKGIKKAKGKIGSLNMKLYDACRDKKINSAKLLLELKADPNVYNGEGFKHALKTKDYSLIDSFINHKVNLQTSPSPIIGVLSNKDEKMARYLVDKGINMDTYTLSIAIRYEMIDVFHYMMKKRGVQDYDNPEYLSACVYNENIKLMEFLVEHGANLKAFIHDRFWLSLNWYSASVFEYFVKKKLLKIDSESLFNAVKNNKEHVVSLITDHGIQLNKEQIDALLKWDKYICDEILKRFDLKCTGYYSPCKIERVKKHKRRY